MLLRARQGSEVEAAAATIANYQRGVDEAQEAIAAQEGELRWAVVRSDYLRKSP